jgi:hypothetical protein
MLTSWYGDISYPLVSQGKVWLGSKLLSELVGLSRRNEFAIRAGFIGVSLFSKNISRHRKILRALSAYVDCLDWDSRHFGEMRIIVGFAKPSLC